MLDSQLVKEGEVLTNWTSGVLASRRPGIPSRIQIADGATVLIIGSPRKRWAGPLQFSG